ncbi:DoxX family protein (plasmid) [Streptomyces xanthophaeus]|uniref:DoxX family protein n=1 Tax=Streptomyces xanthophaeus TaxID=67385 RepID=UPI002F9070C6|nr:DoxX family protein [Streptomyces xanthophaeus]WST65954.1 DoxX family protein [Streptomyces xanthophaeus]
MRTYGQIARFLEGIGASFGIAALRISIGIIFLWFGVPKLFPGVSPAETLAADTVEKLTFGIIEGTTASVLTGLLEAVIGVLLVSGKMRSLTIMILLGHMAGTFTPLFIFPKETWEAFCIGTLEGQYILKNLVIVAAALAIAGHSKPRRRLVAIVKDTAEPTAPRPLRPPSPATAGSVTAPDRAS